MHRRLASREVSNAGNSRDQNVPNTYEMSNIANSQQSQYEIVQSEASAPAQSTNASKPSVPLPRTSQHDFTLIENDLYE